MNNYFAWSNDMEIISRGKGIWKFVEAHSATNSSLGTEPTIAEDSSGHQAHMGVMSEENIQKGILL